MKFRGNARHPSSLPNQQPPPPPPGPQCQTCSQKQAVAVKMGRSHLVFHQILHNGGRSTAWHWAGVLVGMRHHHTAAPPPNHRWMGLRR